MIRIAFEAVDGAGKTTALKYCLQELIARGYTAIETREVGNPNVPICVKLREVVLAPKSNLSGDSMELIFSAMRMENEHWYKRLAESDDAPDFVLSDREYLSHVAYTDHNVNEEFSEALYENFMFKRTSFPDVVLYFKVDTATALKRRVKRGAGTDVIEMKGIEFQNKVRDSFEKYLKKFATRKYAPMVFTIDANQDLEQVQRDLRLALDIITDGFLPIM